MVMRNRHDGANVPEWWDDLPPSIKKRCTDAPLLKSQNHRMVDEQQLDNLSSSPLGIARDLSWLALIFIAIAFANLLFLLAALSFLHGRGLFGA